MSIFPELTAALVPFLGNRAKERAAQIAQALILGEPVLPTDVREVLEGHVRGRDLPQAIFAVMSAIMDMEVDDLRRNR